ncbi:peptidase M50 [Candidatus Koribacter versatilis Ellin345]|uniref:Peptidase M50 n=1 Tax=Koribacter versatilis (strain Ellin345) TaxID=204669 RepID=Q1IJU1_KORVE|nr:site-2 protease family protein [Candidatus Koribacter versatilis]ABF42859.1 peptidase M50 [Candidatus Koribacter versatilis Ellin345]
MSFNPAEIFFQMVAFLFAISLHEAAHAWTADRCGDPTAKMLGRITLNPLRHIDPIGSLVLPIIGLISHIGFIGWARPTPVEPRNFRRPVRDDILVTLAGPASNLFLVIVFGFLLKGLVIFARTHQIPESMEPLLYLSEAVVFINILLFVFNLLPIPPLDGSHVVRHFLSPDAQRVYDRVGTYGLMLFFIASWYFNILGVLIHPLNVAFQRIFLT